MKKMDSTEVRQTPMITGDSQISGRTAHSTLTSPKVRLTWKPPRCSKPALADPMKRFHTTEMRRFQVIGNRGDTDGGNYLTTPGTGIETSAIVMVWNTVDSPGVELPSLSNLDVTATNPIYEQYFLKSGRYDIVGFRLNVQTVYDGIIAAINQAVAGGTLNLGGMSADQWVHSQPAHLCAKVVIRQQGGVFPNFGDTPINNMALAQKNLAPFDINVQDDHLIPNITWKNFIVGQPFFLKLPGAGANRLSIETQLPP